MGANKLTSNITDPPLTPGEQRVKYETCSPRTYMIVS